MKTAKKWARGEKKKEQNKTKIGRQKTRVPVFILKKTGKSATSAKLAIRQYATMLDVITASSAAST